MDEKNMIDEVWELWNTHKRGEIAARVESEGDTTTVLKRYLGLQGDLYWEKNNLEAVLSLSGFGRSYADRMGQKEAENVLLYNTASFTLPWWSDSLPTTPWQRHRGLDAAMRLLAIRMELGKGPADFSKAHWVIGAHHLYRGDAEKAVAHFNEALLKAREAGEKNLEACALEGLGRTRIRLSPGDRDWGFENIGEARALYGEVDDKFNLGELEVFLGGKPL